MKRTFLIVLSLCAMLIGKAQERPVLDLSNNNCRFEVGYNKVNAARKSKVDDNTARMQSIKQLGV